MIPAPVKAFLAVGLAVAVPLLVWLALKLMGLVGEPDRGLGF